MARPRRKPRPTPTPAPGSDAQVPTDVADRRRLLRTEVQSYTDPRDKPPGQP